MIVYHKRFECSVEFSKWQERKNVKLVKFNSHIDDSRLVISVFYTLEDGK